MPGADWLAQVATGLLCQARGLELALWPGCLGMPLAWRRIEGGSFSRLASPLGYSALLAMPPRLEHCHSPGPGGPPLCLSELPPHCRRPGVPALTTPIALGCDFPFTCLLSSPLD